MRLFGEVSDPILGLKRWKCQVLRSWGERLCHAISKTPKKSYVALWEVQKDISGPTYRYIELLLLTSVTLVSSSLAQNIMSLIERLGTVVLLRRPNVDTKYAPEIFARGKNQGTW